MEFVQKLDSYGRAGWLTAMIVGFVVFWPVGLAILGYMIWSGRMGCWSYGGPGRWYYDNAEGGRAEKRRRRRERRSRRHAAESTGNRAFDEYREETLRRLEDEQREFEEFLENLRHAKDKAEFDQFMAGRRNRGGTAKDAPEGPGEAEAPPAG